MRSRTVAVAVPASYNQGGPEKLSWGTKAPGDTLSYALDCTAWCADAGDHVQTFTAQASDPALVIGAASHSDDVLTVRLSGGAAGHSYGVTFTMQLASGAVLTRVVWLSVNTISVPPGYFGGLVIPAGPAGPATSISVRADSTGWTADRT